MNLKPFKIEILRCGRFRDGAGAAHVFDRAALDDIAAAFAACADKWRAPAVIGHPSDDSPAFGWTEKVERAGDRLLAHIRPTIKEFADGVRRGSWPRVSIALFGKRAAANPTPGRPMIRHIGFLGGQAPAVPGLASAQFGAPPTDSVILFADGAAGAAAAAQNDNPDNHKTEPSDMTDKNADFAAREAILQQREAALQTAEAEAARLKQDNERLAAQFAAQAAEAREGRVQKWIADGKLPPAQARAAGDILARAQNPGEFAAQDDQGLDEMFCDFVDGLAKHGCFGELPQDAESSAPKMSARQRGEMIAKYAADNKVDLLTAEEQLVAAGKLQKLDMINTREA